MLFSRYWEIEEIFFRNLSFIGTHVIEDPRTRPFDHSVTRPSSCSPSQDAAKSPSSAALRGRERRGRRRRGNHVTEPRLIPHHAPGNLPNWTVGAGALRRAGRAARRCSAPDTFQRTLTVFISRMRTRSIFLKIGNGLRFFTQTRV